MPKNITIYIDDELLEEMKIFPEVNWSKVCRQGIKAYMGGRTGGESLLAKILERLEQIEIDMKLLKRISVKTEEPKEKEES